MDTLDRINAGMFWLENKGVFERTPAFFDEPYEVFPEFQVLEDHYDVIAAECRALLAERERLTTRMQDVSRDPARPTDHGIHVIDWRAFMFKAGDWVEENCAQCPKTARLLRTLPRAWNIFFSILEPRQYITPHWGYFKGFLRYHLGVVIPENNKDEKCWLRVNADPDVTAMQFTRQRPLGMEPHNEFIQGGEKRHWKNGKGFVFDDMYLHDASNESDEVRVILWIDVERPYPRLVQPVVRSMLNIAYSRPGVKEIANRTRVRTTPQTRSQEP